MPVLKDDFLETRFNSDVSPEEANLLRRAAHALQIPNPVTPQEIEEMRARIAADPSLTSKGQYDSSNPLYPDLEPATPKAKEFAEKEGIDLKDVTGSGKNGQVQYMDVMKYRKAIREMEAELAAEAEGHKPELSAETLKSVEKKYDEAADATP